MVIQIELMFKKKKIQNDCNALPFWLKSLKTLNLYYFIRSKNTSFVWFNAKINLPQKIIQCTSIRICFNCQITPKHVLSFCIGYCYGSEETGCIDTLQQSQPTNSFLVFVEGLKGAWSFLLVKGLYCKVWPWMAVPFTQTGVLLCFWFGQTFKTNLQIKKTWLNVIVGITKQSSVVCSPCRCCGPR